MDCDYCGEVFDPISTRWLCPVCRQKANCCEGSPQGVDDESVEKIRRLRLRPPDFVTGPGFAPGTAVVVVDAPSVADRFPAGNAVGVGGEPASTA